MGDRLRPGEARTRDASPKLGAAWQPVVVNGQVLRQSGEVPPLRTTRRPALRAGLVWPAPSSDDGAMGTSCTSCRSRGTEHSAPSSWFRFLGAASSVRTLHRRPGRPRRAAVGTAALPPQLDPGRCTGRSPPDSRSVSSDVSNASRWYWSAVSFCAYERRSIPGLGGGHLVVLRHFVSVMFSRNSTRGRGQ